MKPEREPSAIRSLVVLLLVLVFFGACACFFWAPPVKKVSILFKGMERVYADHEFRDVALFSFTNHSRLVVDRYVCTVRTRTQPGFGSPVRTYIHDEDTTNQLIFHSARVAQLNPGKGEVIAIPVMHGSNQWRVELRYSYEGLRYKLTLWLGPTKGGRLVPGWLRAFQVHSFESDWLQPLADEPAGSLPPHEFNRLETGMRSALEYRTSTNTVSRRFQPLKPNVPAGNP